MLYQLFRPLLFKLDPENAHWLAFHTLNQAHKLGLLKNLVNSSVIHCKPRTVMGLSFSNPVGLAAGLDKNGEYIDALASLGFGFIEIGTVTPRPQPGNPRPRIFRIPEANAIINRLGFNNLGIDHLLSNVKNSSYRGILGINLGKNFDTPLENAIDDYLIGLQKAYCCASYVTINISSPNTKNLRQLQGSHVLDQLLGRLKLEQTQLSQTHSKFVPMVIKIAPDLNDEEIKLIADLLLKHQIDGVIATNTTISRESIEQFKVAEELGGLSGAPLTQRATQVIRQLHAILQNAIPIIGVGGIMSSKDAQDKLDSGADLIQLYTGLIYQGTDFVNDVIQTVCNNDTMRTN